MIRSHWFITGLLLATFASAVSAFVDPPVIVPAHPGVGETVSVSVTAGTCDAFEVRPGYPQVSRDGNAFRIVFASVHAESADWCIFLPATTTAVIGQFQSGHYTLQVDRTYDRFDGPVVETLGVLPIVVMGAVPVEVQTLRPYSIVALIIAVLAVVAITLRGSAAVRLAALLILVPFGAQGQMATDVKAIAFLLAAGDGVPSEQSLVDYYAPISRNNKPPLASLAGC